MKPYNQNFQVNRVNQNLIEVFRHEPPEYLKEYIPLWNFNFWMYMETDRHFVNTLGNFLESIEQTIIDQYEPVHDSSTGLGNNTVTSRSHHYNLFRETAPVALHLHKIIKSQITRYLEQTNPKIFQDPNFDPHINCWFNVMAPGEEIKSHTHNVTNPFISGHFTVRCENSYTYYIVPYTRDRIEMTNNIGEGIIFPSYMEHGTSIHQGNANRISIAWDLYYNKDDTFDTIKNNVEPVDLK